MSIIEIKQVGYSYDNKKKVLKGVNAEMEQGKLYAILGPSGCGKTTLLSLIGGLDSLIGAVSMGIATGLILSVVSGYSDSSNAPVVALVLLALNLLIKPEGIFGHNSARSV